MAPASSVAKWTALTLMLIQNAGFVLVMRYSRKQQASAPASQYNVSFVVTLQEGFKLVLCSMVLALQHGSIAPAIAPLTRPRELVRIAIPAVCFVLQNNILYVALSNLDPLLFQITYQIKTLLTALFSVGMLGKTFTRVQWLSQLALMAGIVLVQLSDALSAKASKAAAHTAVASLDDGLAPPSAMQPPPPAAPPFDSVARNVPLGLAAVLVAAVSSAFASVYFEKILKAAPPPAAPGAKVHTAGGSGSPNAPSRGAPAAGSSLWERNIELCAWTVPLNLMLATWPSSNGGIAQLVADPLKGFDASTWGIIVVNGIGGLLVAAVIKYADNIWKGFATAGAIVLTGAIAPMLDLGPPPTLMLVMGASLVVASLLLYAMPASRQWNGQGAHHVKS